MGLCSSQAKKVEGGDKPENKKQETKQETATEQKAPAAAEEPKKEEPAPTAVAAEEPKKEEPAPAAAVAAEEPKKEEPAPAAVAQEEAKPAAAAAPVVAAEDLPPYTNRPEDLEGIPLATGTYKPRKWDLTTTPDLSAAPALTGEIVTDGKVTFDKAVLELEGVFPTRDEEVAQLQKAIDMKKDAGAETGKANALHEEHNKLYEAGEKDAAKEKLAESKVHRENAKKIHEDSFDLAVAGAMSMALKAMYSKYPSVDYHVFLMDPFEKSFEVVLDMAKKYQKYGRKDFMLIPGEGQHSDKSKGPAIRPHLEQWMADNKVENTQITSGSFAIVLASVPARQ